jgi:hypothetical protein
MMCKTTLHPNQAVVTAHTMRYNINRLSAFWAHS